jgi:hypothetical protein
MASGRISMFDSVDVGALPKGAGDWAIAGYVGGRYQTWNDVVRLYPAHRKRSIAVFASLDADILDVEAGDATPSQAPAWVRRQHARGIARPGVYIQLSNAQELVNVLAGAGIGRGQYLLWTAHYTGSPHIESGSDATQWTDSFEGRNCDASLCEPWFFGVRQKPPSPDHLPLTVDGVFGPQTIMALQWCLDHKPRAPKPLLAVDGAFGPATRVRLEQYLKVRKGGRTATRALQKHVGATVDGDWGPSTTRHLQTALNQHKF